MPHPRSDSACPPSCPIRRPWFCRCDLVFALTEPVPQAERGRLPPSPALLSSPEVPGLSLPRAEVPRVCGWSNLTLRGRGYQSLVVSMAPSAREGPWHIVGTPRVMFARRIVSALFPEQGGWTPADALSWRERGGLEAPGIPPHTPGQREVRPLPGRQL